MSTEHIVETIPGVYSGADYSASGQYKWVKFDATVNEIKIVTATTDLAVGILQDNPKSGQAASVAIRGISKVLAGTSVGWTAGGSVGWNTTGQAVPVGASATLRSGGTYLLREASVAIGQLINVSLHGGSVIN